MECLADAFEADELHLFNPVPLETIALAGTAVIIVEVCFVLSDY